MAGLACRCGNPTRAITLLGASNSLRGKKAIALLSAKAEEYQRNLMAARAQVDEADFDHYFSEGLAMSADQAIAYAID